MLTHHPQDRWLRVAGRLLELPAVVVFAAILLAPSAVLAQLPEVQFSYSNPGARSLGMAGAFVALSDDASAVYSNPAGLVLLTTREVSLEARQWDYATPFTAAARVSGQPTGMGIDTLSGVRADESDETLRGLSFLSFVLPLEQWRFALYRHQTANWESRAATQGIFSDGPGPIYPPPRWADTRITSDLDIVNIGISGAYEITERLSVGAGVSRFNIDLEDRWEVFAPPADPFAPSGYLPTDLTVVRRTTVDDDAWGFNAGILWRFAERWTLGSVYRSGPEFDLKLERTSGPAYPLTPFDTLDVFDLKLPDVFGVAVSFQSDNVTLTAEWDRVGYSNLIDDAFFPSDLDDGNEFRVGFEYLFRSTQPAVALRSGIWFDPDHTFNISVGGVTDPLFPPGDDELHYAMGVGFAFEQVKLDIGVDLSELVDTAAVSLIFRF